MCDSFYLWTDFNSSSETPINCRNLTVPRPVLNCSNWGSFKNLGVRKKSYRPHWIHLCHQQMSQCAGPPIQRFRPVDVIPCHQLVFRLEDIPLRIQMNKSILLTEECVVLCYWVEQSGRPGWRLILIWLSSQSIIWNVKICQEVVTVVENLNVSSKPYPEAASGLVAGGWTLASPCKSVRPHET